MLEKKIRFIRPVNNVLLGIGQYIFVINNCLLYFNNIIVGK